MGSIRLDDILVTPLRIIPHVKGDIFHAIKKSDDGFQGFGEAYFSSINYGEIKGWQRHSRMALNLIVPVGVIKIVVIDIQETLSTNRKSFEIILSHDNYKRLTIPPGLWFGFKGMNPSLNLLLNIASIEHDPAESEKIDLSLIPYEW